MSTRQEVRRADDGELVGFIEEASGQWRPQTIFGSPIGERMSEVAARELIISQGLASLAEPWWYLAPGAQVRGRCFIVEASQNKAVISMTDPRYGIADRTVVASPISKYLCYTEPQD